MQLVKHARPKNTVCTCVRHFSLLHIVCLFNHHSLSILGLSCLQMGGGAGNEAKYICLDIVSSYMHIMIKQWIPGHSSRGSGLGTRLVLVIRFGSITG